MGGCVISLMDRRAQSSDIVDPAIERLKKYGPQSLPLKGTETDTSSPIYLNGKRPSLEEQRKSGKTYYYGPNQAERFQKLCLEHLDDVAMTYRRVEKVVKETVEGSSRPLDVSYLSDQRSVKYRELYDAFMSFSRGLAELGLEKRCNVSIYEETRWEWLATIYGIWMQDMVASTVYANLGEDALFYALRETECAAIVCNGKSVPLLLHGIAAGEFPACTIIYLDELPVSGCEDTHGCRVIAWTAVVELGRSQSGKKRAAAPPQDNESVALIMYTSGTTGNPKGVMHTHGSIVAGILSMDDWLYSCIQQRDDDVYLSYLPLAHILEFGVVNILLARHAHVAFGNPRTLTDNMAKPHGDFIEYRPTLFIGVPRVFDTLKRAVEAKLPAPGTLKRQVFDHAYQRRLAAIHEGKETPYWNEKVFKVARAALGGSFDLLLSGGGPLSAATQEFVNVVFGFLINGWGLTETICVGAIQRIGDLTPAAVGQVLEMEELKLVDTEEYKHTDQPEPRGELCLRGPFMFKGYYKQPELTKEAFDEDGWFHTGDIGSIDSEGRVSVIGRIKALAKNCLGEYIALETLEAIYVNSPLVLNNCVCVLVHPDKNYICALVLTDEGKVKRFAKEHGIAGEYPALLKNKELLKKAAETMATIAKNAKRKNFELLRNVCLLDDEWSPENGVLTAALKLKRNVINERYAKEIKELFAQ